MKSKTSIECDCFRNAMSHDNKFGSGPIDNSERTKLENLDQAIAEIERLRKDGEKLQGELSGKLLFVSFLLRI